MLIEQNPFYILEVSTKDTKQTILDKAEEKALFEDPETIEQAKEALLDSGKRLDAELGWFVYASREEEQLLSDLLHGRNAGRTPIEFHDSYDQANYQMAVIAKRNYTHLPENTFGKNTTDILRILEIDPDDFLYSDFLDEINKNREKSGMPCIDENDFVDHLYQRRPVIIDALKAKMNELTVDQLLASIRFIAYEMTKHGEERASELVESLLTMYDMETRQFADKQAARIHRSISFAQQAKDAPEENRKTVLSQALNEIVAGMKNWQRVMEPLQILALSQGREHEPSMNLLRDVRNAAIDMNNEYDEPQFARQLTVSLEDLHVAKFFPEFQSAFEKDKKTLDGIIEGVFQSVLAEYEEEVKHELWAAKIHYKAELGTVLQNGFELSEHGINYDGHLTPLENIVGLSWGVIRNSINGIPSGTDYQITYFDGSRYETLKPDKNQFEEIVSRLWEAFVMIILSRICKSAANGDKLNIGRIEFNDGGVVLKRTGIFHSDSRLFSWAEPLRAYADNGNFFITDESGKYQASASYITDMNTHFFDALVHVVIEHHCQKLSDILKK